MKYIDAEKLVAALEKRLNENCSLGEKAECFNHRAHPCYYRISPTGNGTSREVSDT